MGNAASASYSVFSTIPGLSVARKTLIFQCFQKYRYLTSALGGPAFAPFCWGCLSFSALTGQSSVAHSS
ncbi:hypothetical protein DW233_05000 [Collinsella sp. AM20-15AC]|nr:hypothetical protein DW233_05000 [Collinsella sp. AM20-15AC]